MLAARGRVGNEEPRDLFANEWPRAKPGSLGQAKAEPTQAKLVARRHFCGVPALLLGAPGTPLLSDRVHAGTDLQLRQCGKRRVRNCGKPGHRAMALTQNCGRPGHRATALTQNRYSPAEGDAKAIADHSTVLFEAHCFPT